MKAILFALMATVSAPAMAQHAGHTGHEGHEAAPPTQASDPHAGHAQQPADPHAGHGVQAPTPPETSDPHAGHFMPSQTPPASDPHAGHQMPATADPHAGHTMPEAPDPHAGHNAPAAAEQADPHAGHDMSSMAAESPPIAPPSDAARSGPAHAADLVFGAQAMAAAREGVRREHGDMRVAKFLVDRAEVNIRDGRDGYAWDAQFWHGGDIDKFWMKSEGEGAFGESLEKADVQALWSHAVNPWFDLQTGIRQDFGAGPDRTHFVLGLQGLAPYWFEVDGALFLSTKGDVTARFEGEYDLRITQKLVLQPRAEVELAMQDVPELGLGSGLSSAALGMRLRYQIQPEFAPYVGVEYERAFGDTARFAEADGHGRDSIGLVLGVRAWF